MWLETCEAYEGLDSRAIDAFAEICQAVLDRWSLSFPVLARLALDVTVDPIIFPPEMYVEPYQIVAIHLPTNQGLRAVITVRLSPSLPSNRQLWRTTRGTWWYGPGPASHLSWAFYHELGHVLDLAERLRCDPAYQPDASDRAELEAGANQAMRSQFPESTVHATGTAIRNAWRPYRRWRWIGRRSRTSPNGRDLGYPRDTRRPPEYFPSGRPPLSHPGVAWAKQSARCHPTANPDSERPTRDAIGAPAFHRQAGPTANAWPFLPWAPWRER